MYTPSQDTTAAAQSALNELGSSLHTLRADNERLIRENVALKVETGTLIGDKIILNEIVNKLLAEKAALQKRAEELQAFPVIQAGRILDLQKENEALRAEIQSLRASSSSPGLPAETVQDILLAVSPAVPLDQIVAEAVSAGEITPSLASRLAVARTTGRLLTDVHIVTQDVATISLETQALADELTHCMAVDRRHQEEVTSAQTVVQDLATISHETQALADELTHCMAAARYHNELARRQASASIVSRDIMDLLSECGKVSDVLDRQVTLTAQAQARTHALKHASFVTRRTAEIVAQQAQATAISSELMELLADCQAWDDELAAEIATRRAARQSELKAKKQAEKARRAAEEKARADLVEQRRLRDEASRKKRDEERLSRRSAGAKREATTSLSGQTAEFAQELAQLEQALALSREITTANQSVKPQPGNNKVSGLDALLQAESDDDDEILLPRVADPDQRKKAIKALRKETKARAAQEEQERQTRQAQEIARLLSKQLGKPEPDQRARFCVTQFHSFVQALQAAIRDTPCDHGTAPLSAELPNPAYLDHLSLVKLYVEDRLGATDNIKVLALADRYSLDFRLLGALVSESFTTTYVPLETIVAWVDRADFKQACWTQFPESGNPKMRTIANGPAEKLLAEFENVIRHEEFGRLSLAPTGQVDNFDFPVYTLRKLDSARTRLYCTVFQLILWWRMGIVRALANSERALATHP